MDPRYLDLYQRLLDVHGPQGWWPADSPFEVIIGAILTQNTRWEHVEAGIYALRDLGALTAEALLHVPDRELKAALRPTGYFNQKAERLRVVARWHVDAGVRAGLAKRELAGLRAELLALHGVGPETADDILLYALDIPVFVIDAYTHRLAERYGLQVPFGYEVARESFESNLPEDLGLYQEFHALIFRHGKLFCSKRPRCDSCPLKAYCGWGRSS